MTPKQTVFNNIVGHGAGVLHSVTEISDETGLSVPVVSDALNELVKEDMLSFEKSRSRLVYKLENSNGRE